MQPPRVRDWAAVLAAALLGLTLVCVEEVPAPSTSADWAAWAQAFGTVGAIAVTAWLAFIPVQAERRRWREARVDFLSLVTDAVGLMTSELEPLISAVDQDRKEPIRAAHDRYASSAAKQLVDEVLELPISAWPSAMLRHRVLMLSRAAEHFRNMTWSYYCTAGESAGVLRLGCVKARTSLADAEAAFRQSLRGVPIDR